MFRNTQLKQLLGHASKEREEEAETFFVIGLEGDEPDASFSIGHRIVDSLVKTFQPPPVLTHVELLLPPSSPRDETHFSTYLGRNAAYGSTFADSRNFYLGPSNINSWRATPVMGPRALKSARATCDGECNTPYSLCRYVFSCPPGRALAGLLPDSAGWPAHCAALSARIIRDSMPGFHLPHHALWYSPSTLYLELTKPSRMAEYHDLVNETTPSVTAITQDEEVNGTVEVLLHGSDRAVELLTHLQCRVAIDSMCTNVIRQRATGSDQVKERILEKQLAKALLRWVELVRNDGVIAGRGFSHGSFCT